MQVAKKIPFEDPTVLNSCRAVYVLSNLIILGIYLYIRAAIKAKKGTFELRGTANPTTVRCRVSTQQTDMTWPPSTDMTTLKYVEPAPMGSSEEGKPVTTTVQQYDLGQLKTMMRSQMMGVAMMAVMHLYFKYTNPLIIQSIIPLKGAFEANLTKIHLFGHPAAGDLKRPFKQAAGLMSGLQSGPVQSDKKAVEAAEKAGRGGVKEE